MAAGSARLTVDAESLSELLWWVRRKHALRLWGSSSVAFGREFLLGGEFPTSRQREFGECFENTSLRGGQL
jgi:hypothetical protein